MHLEKRPPDAPNGSAKTEPMSLVATTKTVIYGVFTTLASATFRSRQLRHGCTISRSPQF